jgi:ribosomal protein L40E
MALIECTECNAEISNKASTCPRCGAPAKTSIELRPSVEEGPVFFDQRGVCVTATLLTLPGGRSYAMSGITAVHPGETPPKRTVPVALLVICTVLTFSGAHACIFGAVGALIWLCLQRSIYFVVLTTSSGETQALSDRDSAWIARVIAALNQSIVYRG